MPSRVSNGAQGVTPNLVEVKPRNLAPSTPSPPGSPKAVRFAPSSTQSISRPVNNKEEWSLWHFENHASQCRYCYDPYRAYKEGSRLCSEGHALAQDVAINVFYKAGDIYARHKEDHKLVRVELQPGYRHVIGLLRSMDHHIRGSTSSSSSKGRPPVVSYDKSYPVSARYSRDRTPESRKRFYEERPTVTIEPASSKPERRKSTHHRDRTYEPVAVKHNDHDDERPTSSSSSKYKEHRGSLYDVDFARLERERRYNVEVREPEGTSSSRRRRDRDGRRKERHE